MYRTLSLCSVLRWHDNYLSLKLSPWSFREGAYTHTLRRKSEHRSKLNVSVPWLCTLHLLLLSRPNLGTGHSKAPGTHATQLCQVSHTTSSWQAQFSLFSAILKIPRTAQNKTQTYPLDGIHELFSPASLTYSLEDWPPIFFFLKGQANTKFLELAHSPCQY